MTRTRTTPPRRGGKTRNAAARKAGQGPTDETGVGQATAPAGAVGTWLARAASAAVTLAAFALAFHKIDDFDTWWHLAAGRWIAVHHAVPATDTLSHTVRDHAWTDVQWAFDLVLYLLHALGGPALLCLSGALVFVAAVLLLMRLVNREIGPGFGALVILVVILTAQQRVTLRPELASFLLLAAVLTVQDHARRHDGRGLFLLVPLMIVWANMHALFVLGAFAIVSALVGTGTRASRHTLAWSGAALASVLITPYGLTGALFPLKLISRINGSNPAFRTIGEFESPFSGSPASLSIGLYQVLLAVSAAVVLLALVLSLRARRSPAGSIRPRFDWGGLIFFTGLAVLSAAARRNVAIFAIGTAPFLAQCLQIVLSAAPRMRALSARLLPVAGATATMAAVLVMVTTATGAFYRFDKAAREPGAGVIDGTFPVRGAAFARAAALPPSLYNDMSTGGYLTWDDPLDGGVFIDGRLEVYDADFVSDYVTALTDQHRWQAQADRYGIQTAIVFHRFENHRVLAGRLFRDHAWTLVYADEVAAIFVRTQGNDAAIARALAMRAEWNAKTDAWMARPVTPRPYLAGRAEGTRAYARFLATIGAGDAAVVAYQHYVALGVPANDEVDVRVLLARYFASRGRRDEAEEQARRILALDPDNADARRIQQAPR